METLLLVAPVLPRSLSTSAPLRSLLVALPNSANPRRRSLVGSNPTKTILWQLLEVRCTTGICHVISQ
jgi:hypothetical protein